MTPGKHEPVAITQADRDAAADAMQAGYISPAGVIAHVRAGRSDENAFVQAFARYRIAHSAAVTKDAFDDYECTECCEVYGENPLCTVHGRGTHWAKANPDIPALLDRHSAQLERLRSALEWLANVSVAYNAHPVGVIETMRERARAALRHQRGEGT